MPAIFVMLIVSFVVARPFFSLSDNASAIAETLHIYCVARPSSIAWPEMCSSYVSHYPFITPTYRHHLRSKHRVRPLADCCFYFRGMSGSSRAAESQADPSSSRLTAKRAHRKSRGGCRNCKSRRVKVSLLSNLIHRLLADCL